MIHYVARPAIFFSSEVSTSIEHIYQALEGSFERLISFSIILLKLNIIVEQPVALTTLPHDFW